MSHTVAHDIIDAVVRLRHSIAHLDPRQDIPIAIEVDWAVGERLSRELAREEALCGRRVGSNEHFLRQVNRRRWIKVHNVTIAWDVPEGPLILDPARL